MLYSRAHWSRVILLPFESNDFFRVLQPLKPTTASLFLVVRALIVIPVSSGTAAARFEGVFLMSFKNPDTSWWSRQLVVTGCLTDFGSFAITNILQSSQYPFVTFVASCSCKTWIFTQFSWLISLIFGILWTTNNSFTTKLQKYDPQYKTFKYGLSKHFEVVMMKPRYSIIQCTRSFIIPKIGSLLFFIVFLFYDTGDALSNNPCLLF